MAAGAGRVDAHGFAGRGELAAWLCFRERGAASGLAFRKGGVLWLRGAPSAGGMLLEAALKPSLLRRVGELVVAPGDEPRPDAGLADLAD